jgi:3-phenylpropionate/cinnamic acid dioxygenase small subunit
VDTVARLTAESDIRNLIAHYPQLADDGAAQEWSELFAEDGVLRVGSKNPQGRVALAEWLAESVQRATMRHIIVNAAVSVDSSTDAHGSSDLVLLVAKDDAWTVATTGRYADRYVKVAEGWRIAERVLTVRKPSA